MDKRSLVLSSLLFLGSCGKYNFRVKHKVYDKEFNSLGKEDQDLFLHIKNAIEEQNKDSKGRYSLDTYKKFLSRSFEVDIKSHKSLLDTFRDNYGDSADLNFSFRICENDDVIAFRVKIARSQEDVIKNLILSYKDGDLDESHNSQIYKAIFNEKSVNILSFLVKSGLFRALFDKDLIVSTLSLPEIELGRKKQAYECVEDILIDNPLHLFVDVCKIRVSSIREIRQRASKLGLGDKKREMTIREVCKTELKSEEDKIASILNILLDIPDIFELPSYLYEKVVSEDDVTWRASESVKLIDGLASKATPRKGKIISRKMSKRDHTQFVAKIEDEIDSIKKKIDEVIARISDRASKLNSLLFEQFGIKDLESFLEGKVNYLSDEIIKGTERFAKDPKDAEEILKIFDSREALQIELRNLDAILKQKRDTLSSIEVR